MSSKEVQAFTSLTLAVLVGLLNLLFVCFLLVIYIYIGVKTNDDPANFSPIQLMSLSWGLALITRAALVMAGATFKVGADREAGASDASA